MKKNSKLLMATVMVMASVYMIGCGASSNEAEIDVDVVETDFDNVEIKQAEPIDIQLVSEGQSYSVDEKCNVLETYDEYSIQADVNDVYALLMQDNFESIEFRTHIVEQVDESNSENGKYDVVDNVNVKVAFTDEFGLIPQSVTKDVVMAREVASGNWVVVGETCKKWEAKHKKLGGTSWKLVTDNGVIYFRLRDTIEFFSTEPDNINLPDNETEFFTTILGAMYMNVDGEDKLRRIHVMSGTLSDLGEIILRLEFVNEKESMEINLNDCEKIERDELPFTEEEFREVSDQLG